MPSGTKKLPSTNGDRIQPQPHYVFASPFFFLAVLGTAALWSLFVLSGWAIHTFLACFADSHQVGMPYRAVACSGAVLRDFFLDNSNSPLAMVVMNETFRLFFVGAALAVYESFKTSSPIIMLVVGVLPLVGQFITGACGSIPLSLALAHHPENHSASPSLLIQIWAAVFLLGLPLLIFHLLNASRVDFSLDFSLGEWTWYLVAPLAPHLLTPILFRLSPPSRPKPVLMRVPLLALGFCAFGAQSAFDFWTEVAACSNMGPLSAQKWTIPKAAVAMDLALLFVTMSTWVAQRTTNGLALAIAAASLLGPGSAFAVACAMLID